jgi:hypothetical protein
MLWISLERISYDVDAVATEIRSVGPPGELAASWSAPCKQSHSAFSAANTRNVAGPNCDQTSEPLAGSARDDPKTLTPPRNMAICSALCAEPRVFYRSDGLEPATSGVTGRSWRLRAEPGSAGIPGTSRAFRPRRCGDWPVLAGASGDLLRDVRGMRVLPQRQRRDACGTVMLLRCRSVGRSPPWRPPARLRLA